MIYAIQLDKQTGEVNKKSSGSGYNQSYNHIYLVITDNTDSPKDIYDNAKENGLPVYGDKLDNIPVSRVSLQRRSEDNAKAAPSYGLPVKSKGSYAVWDYEVEYNDTEDSGGGGGSGSGEAPWKKDYATNCSISPKTYTEFTNLGYRNPTKPKKTIIRNAAGDSIFRNAEKRNFVLSFDYAQKSIPIKYISEFINTVNKDKITVAGVVIPQGCGCITNLTYNLGEWENDTYTNIHVEIEIKSQKSVLYDEILGTGYRAFPESGGGGDSNKAYPIQEFTGSTADFNKLDNGSVVWLDKKHGLGSFGSATINGQSIAGMYQNVDERKVLDKKGRIYYIDPTKEEIDLDDPNLNLIKVYDRKAVSWKALDMPKDGFKS